MDPLQVTSCVHVVFGPPAAGKTTYAKELAARIHGILLDSDEVTDRLIRAGMTLAGRDPEDRDSPAYKAAFRDPVYETLFDLACSHAHHLPVVIAAPFTREGGDLNWPDHLKSRLGTLPEFHFVWCDPEQRRQRVQSRGMDRDHSKLADWPQYILTCRETPPVFPHHWIDTTSA
jgi:predicted kinase